MSATPPKQRRDRTTPAPDQQLRQQGDHDQEQPNAQREGEIGPEDVEIQPSGTDSIKP